MSEIKVRRVGGTEQDEKDLLEAFQAFWKANNTLDIPALKELWLDDDEAVYFNSNGFNYNGFKDWLGVWRYYGPRFRLIKEASLSEVQMFVDNEVAVVLDGAVERLYEVDGEVDGPPIASHPLMRGTMVYRKIDGKWWCVHAHYSPKAIEGTRPWAPEEGAEA